MFEYTKNKLVKIYEGLTPTALPESQRFTSILSNVPVPMETVDLLLTKYKRNKHKVFCDPSCQIADVAIHAGIFNNPDKYLSYNPAIGFFSEVIGLEANESEFWLGQRAAARAIDSRFLSESTKLNLLLADFREVPMYHVDFMFANSALFSDELFIHLQEKMLELRGGARVISIGRELNQSYFELSDSPELRANWKKSKVFIYDRK